MQTTLKPAESADAGDEVDAQMWDRTVEAHASWLGTLTADQIPADRTWFILKGAELASARPDATAARRIDCATHVLLCAIGAALMRQGWTIDVARGRQWSAVRGDNRFDPHIAVGQLADGSMNADYWKTQCASLGIAGLPLAGALPQARIA